MSKPNLGRLQPDQVSRLIGSIYEAALHPERWEEVLLSLAKPIDAHGAQLTAISESARSPIDSLIVGPEADAVDTEFDEMVRCGGHTRVNYCGVAKEFVPIYDYLHTSKSQMRTDPFYQGHAIPNDAAYYGATVLRRDNGNFYVFGMFRRPDIGHMQERDLRYMMFLAPHIRRAIDLTIRLQIRGARKSAGAILEKLSCAAVLIDQNRRVTEVNDKASQLCAMADGLKLERSALRLSDPHSDAQLCTAINSSLSNYGMAAAPDVRGITVPRPSGATPFRIEVAPLSIDSGLFSPRFCLLTISDLDESPQLPTEWLVHEFDLSPAERSVTASLIQGMSIAEISRERGCGQETVRSQVKSVMHKTATKRQAELVSFVMKRILLTQ